MLFTLPLWFDIKYNYITSEFFKINDANTDVSRASLYMTTHYTMVFNTFVLMNLFNQIACRKLGWREINIFDNFFNNLYFFIVVGGEFGL